MVAEARASAETSMKERPTQDMATLKPPSQLSLASSKSRQILPPVPTSGSQFMTVHPARLPI